MRTIRSHCLEMLKIRGYGPLLSGDAICRAFNRAGVSSEKHQFNHHRTDRSTGDKSIKEESSSSMTREIMEVWGSLSGESYCSPPHLELQWTRRSVVAIKKKQLWYEVGSSSIT